jgi:dTDP-4-dehydrorhamnose 3,5-epimerase
MLYHATTLKDAFLIDLETRGDARGVFARTFCAREFEKNGIPTRFVQQNMSRSSQKGTLRGMHRQIAPHEEGKLIRCLRGAIWDCIIDLRPDSPTYMKWEGFELSDANMRELYAPEGFAHGFITLTDDVEVSYLVTGYYEPTAERGIRFNDPAVGIEWPLQPVVVSEKDMSWPDFVS